MYYKKYFGLAALLLLGVIARAMQIPMKAKVVPAAPLFSNSLSYKTLNLGYQAYKYFGGTLQAKDFASMAELLASQAQSISKGTLKATAGNDEELSLQQMSHIADQAYAYFVLQKISEEADVNKSDLAAFINSQPGKDFGSRLQKALRLVNTSIAKLAKNELQINPLQYELDQFKHSSKPSLVGSVSSSEDGDFNSIMSSLKKTIDDNKNNLQMDLSAGSAAVKNAKNQAADQQDSENKEGGESGHIHGEELPEEEPIL